MFKIQFYTNISSALQQIMYYEALAIWGMFQQKQQMNNGRV